MANVWLYTNRRAIYFAMLPQVIILLMALMGVIWGFSGDTEWWHVTVGVATAVLAVLATLLILSYVWSLWRPVIERRDDELLVYLRPQSAERVPLKYVEGFLLGQGPARLTMRGAASAETATLVMRLAESAKEYAHRECLPALGTWCNHYVTIRGTWTEPLSVGLVNRLNQQLADAKQTERTDRGAA